MSPPKPDFDFSSIGFGLLRTDWMYVSETASGSAFEKGVLKPYGGISVEPAATVLNYGQGLFEGMKASRREDGTCAVFRPDRNAARAANGCERLMMPEIPKDVFFDGVFQTIRANSHWIPPANQGSLYLRPLIVGTGAGLGVSPSPWYHFLVFASPVGPYFKKGSSPGVDLVVSDTFHRAAPKGVGHTKSISNYAPAFKEQMAAKAAGYAEAIFLDSTDNYVEEAGAANIFVLDKNGVVRTPGLGSILPGVTRESLVELARDDLGLEVVEGPLHVDEVMEARECWCAGTAAVVSPVASVTYKGVKKEFASHNTSSELYKLHQGILAGTRPDSKSWVVDPFNL